MPVLEQIIASLPGVASLLDDEAGRRTREDYPEAARESRRILPEEQHHDAHDQGDGSCDGNSHDARIQDGYKCLLRVVRVLRRSALIIVVPNALMYALVSAKASIPLPFTFR
jgi:hypothetical protein